jgi:formylglycine-generating enzyme required for sulfatase activity
LRSKTWLNFDLPTEAQWEHAAQATTIRAYNDYTKNGGEGADCTVPSGGADSNLDLLGRYYYNGGSSSKHAVVGSYQPNLWGLFDMYGNGTLIGTILITLVMSQTP